MSAKAILVFCAQALLVQSAFGQCSSRAAVDASRISAPFDRAGFAPGFAYDGLAAPFTYSGLAGPYGYNGLTAPLAYDGLAAPFACDGLAGWAGSLPYEGLYPVIASTMEITPTTSGTLAVTSSSAIPPTGISVVSETAYEGILAVAGEVPFVGTTGMEGVLPTAGAGAINHACGNGLNVMASELTGFAPGYGAAAIAPAAIAPGLAIGNSWAPAASCNGYGLGYLTVSQCIATPGLGAPYGLAAPDLAWDGLAAPFDYDGFASWAGKGLAYDGLAAPFAYGGPAGWSDRGLAYDEIYPAIAPAMGLTPTSGGVFPVTSGSAIAPVGISIASENVYEGDLILAGGLPFVGTTAMEGVLPTDGAGAINHKCGNGINAMVSETAFAPGYTAAAIASTVAPLGVITPAAAITPVVEASVLSCGDWARRGYNYALY